ncbi:MAG TPA: PAAR domain-containing protein [Paraburkholderia sp.]|jgi:hypothetical protein|nr:PAAR domain-containing protein [Paraburkholderia sp.]
MRKALVRNGDPTTTGGVVFAFTSNRSDGAKPIALHGEEATCGICKGMFKIFGTCVTATYRGRASVFDGDLVLCPCGQNRVKAGSDASCFAESTDSPASGGGALSVDSDAFDSRTGGVYDEQLRVTGVADAQLEGYPFLIETQDGAAIAGRVDAARLLPRISTNGPANFTVYWGDEALAHDAFESR